MLRDLYSNLKVIAAKVGSTSDDTAVVGPIVDTRDYSSVMFAIVTGTLADAGATFTTLVEESNDSGMSGAAAVADEDLQGTEAAASFTQADDDAEKKIGYMGNMRYIRPTVTPAGNAGAAPITIVALGIPRHRPAT